MGVVLSVLSDLFNRGSCTGATDSVVVTGVDCDVFALLTVVVGVSSEKVLRTEIYFCNLIFF